MPLPLTRFPCGEYFPGEEPRPLPSQGANTVVPPTYIPDPPRNIPVFKPLTDIPGGPGIPVPGGPGAGSPGGGRGAGGAPGKAGPATPGPGGPAAPGPGGPATPGRPRGPTTPGPGGPAAPGPGQGAPGVGFWKCRELVLRCLPPTGGTVSQRDLERQPIRSILRTPVPCTALQADLDVAEAGGYPFDPGAPYPRNDNGESEASDFCLPSTLATDFLAGCTNSENLNSCITEPNSNSTVLNLDNRSINVGNVGSVSNQQSLTPGSVITNVRANSQVVLRSSPQKQEQTLNLNDPNILRQASTSSSYNDQYGLLDERFNFFKTSPSVSTTIVANSDYTNIFKESVAQEINYFIRRQGTSSVWSEEYFDSLTHDKIVISLRDELLIAFNNIHNIGNTKVSLEYFLELIKNHLITGTLNEFDPNYYYYVYNSQINDTVLRTPQPGESYFGLQAAIGLFELSAVSPDFNKYGDLRLRDDYKRARFLLEDIYANVNSTQLNGNNASLFLKNAGIQAYQLDSSSNGFVDIGNGAGYYISARTINGQELPLVTNNELSSARYLDPALRYNVLKLLGTDIGITVKVDSPSTTNEFSANYNPSADVTPMYFKLDFDSITDLDNPNSVINMLSASYQRISDEDAVDHSRNYSFNLIKVNLDFRDPMVHYARDTSTMMIELNDFNLRGFGDNRTAARGTIMLRSIPAAIIVTPGMGSAHNPFGVRSTLNEYSDTKVSRSINLSPTFEVNQNTVVRPPLDISNIYNTVGTPYYGLYEQYFENDIHGSLYTYNPSSEIFNKSYFNGSYSNSQPDVNYRETSPEAKLVALVDKLSSLSGVSSLTWWDVFRRVPANEIGKLSYVESEGLIKKLSTGWRNDVKIFNVLTRDPVVNSGIPEGAEIENDNIIINEWDR